jgi:AcrR family transcriptional regulator
MPIKADTKFFLVNAFFTLLKEKNFESITIKDVIDKCGASRAALPFFTESTRD